MRVRLNAPDEPDMYGVALKGQLSLEDSRLCAAAQESRVFGGMDSWNDLPFYGEEEYETISDNLYRLINPSLMATANSTFHVLRSHLQDP
ncbi:hypothetical protein [Roseiflexus sp.]|uniref:hypothetical protein n=1 Tax=Roseiflexus sp. TaxID=2562120 RepID=UPI00398A7D6B